MHVLLFLRDIRRHLIAAISLRCRSFRAFWAMGHTLLAQLVPFLAITMSTASWSKRYRRIETSSVISDGTRALRARWKPPTISALPSIAISRPSSRSSRRRASMSGIAGSSSSSSASRLRGSCSSRCYRAACHADAGGLLTQGTRHDDPPPGRTCMPIKASSHGR